jgi:hypothetical protein
MFEKLQCPVTGFSHHLLKWSHQTFISVAIPVEMDSRLMKTFQLKGESHKKASKKLFRKLARQSDIESPTMNL